MRISSSIFFLLSFVLSASEAQHSIQSLDTWLSDEASSSREDLNTLHSLLNNIEDNASSSSKEDLPQTLSGEITDNASSESSTTDSSSKDSKSSKESSDSSDSSSSSLSGSFKAQAEESSSDNGTSAGMMLLTVMFIIAAAVGVAYVSRSIGYKEGAAAGNRKFDPLPEMANTPTARDRSNYRAFSNCESQAEAPEAQVVSENPLNVTTEVYVDDSEPDVGQSLYSEAGIDESEYTTSEYGDSVFGQSLTSEDENGSEFGHSILSESEFGQSLISEDENGSEFGHSILSESEFGQSLTSESGQSPTSESKSGQSPVAENPWFQILNVFTPNESESSIR